MTPRPTSAARPITQHSEIAHVEARAEALLRQNIPSFSEAEMLATILVLVSEIDELRESLAMAAEEYEHHTHQLDLSDLRLIETEEPS